jgi:hypothetical protein
MSENPAASILNFSENGSSNLLILLLTDMQLSKSRYLYVTRLKMVHSVTYYKILPRFLYFYRHTSNFILSRYKTTALPASILTKLINTQQRHVQVVLYRISPRSDNK